MYGMVNRALEDFIRVHHGDEAWQRIVERAAIEPTPFVSNERYDDAITYALVGAAAEQLDVPAESILDGFGRHWVLRTAQEGYADLMDAGGRTLSEFLHALPNFHARVHLYFDDLEPPAFRVTDVGPDAVRLTYISKREGLAPFVRGLLLGLGEMFRTPVEVTLETARDQEHPHDVFLVRWN